MKKYVILLCLCALLCAGCAAREAVPSEETAVSTTEALPLTEEPTAASESRDPNAVDPAQELPAGLYYVPEGLPRIESFSSDHYDPVIDTLPPIVEVNYYADGTVQSLSADDERVYRLLNFISASVDLGRSCSMIYGYTYEEEILSWYDDPTPMLEVCFGESESSIGLSGTSKMLIRKNSLLQVLNPDHVDYVISEGKMIANHYWPYSALWEGAGQSLPYAYKYIDNPGEGMQVWIDMLEYAGFYGE